MYYYSPEWITCSRLSFQFVGYSSHIRSSASYIALDAANTTLLYGEEPDYRRVLDSCKEVRKFQVNRPNLSALPGHLYCLFHFYYLYKYVLVSFSPLSFFFLLFRLSPFCHGRFHISSKASPLGDTYRFWQAS